MSQTSVLFRKHIFVQKETASDVILTKIYSVRNKL